MNITPARLYELCTTDPSWIADFISTNNPNDVADRIADVLGNRPVGLKGIEDALQFLLDQGRTNEFVHVLSVPLSLQGLTPDQAAAMFQAVGIGATPDTLAQGLALNALRLWNAEPSAAPAGKQIQNPNAADAPPQAAADAEKKKRVVRMVLFGIGAALLIVATAYAIRVLRK